MYFDCKQYCIIIIQMFWRKESAEQKFLTIAMMMVMVVEDTDEVAEIVFFKTRRRDWKNRKQLCQLIVNYMVGTNRFLAPFLHTCFL